MTRRDVVLLAGLVVGLAPGAAAQPPTAATPPGAPIQRSSFTYQRRIPPGQAGVASLRLDLAALSHSRLSDIRLVSDPGTQVPYLLEWDPVPLRVTLPELKTVADAGLAGSVSQRGGHHRSVYAVALPYPGIPPCQMVLRTPSRVFDREVTLLARNGDRRDRDRGRWQARAWVQWRHADPDRPAPPLALDLPRLDATDLRLVIDEGDNQALPIAAPVIELRTWRLRFVRESGGELWLVYGRRDLDSPRYDLALLESRLREEPADYVTPEAELQPGGAEAGRRPAFIFWGALVAAVLLLLALIARLTM